MKSAASTFAKLFTLAFQSKVADCRLQCSDQMMLYIHFEKYAILEFSIAVFLSISDFLSRWKKLDFEPSVLSSEAYKKC